MCSPPPEVASWENHTMRTWLNALLLAALLCLTASAQGPKDLTPAKAAEYSSLFESATSAHKSGKYDDAIAGFTQCLAVLPEDPVCAYNITCGHSLKGSLDVAFEWFDKAIGWGFGEVNIDDDQIALAESTDTDLAAMRADPRFEKSLATMKANAKAVEERVNRQVVYVPAALENAETLPVLVLLHDQGQTREALLLSPWKAVADELGLALVLPSARQPVSRDPAQGMTWFANAQTYLKGALKYERTVSAALDAFKKTHKLDKNRTFIAGEGQGGMVAFNVAITSPRLYSGVIVFDAPVIVPLAKPKAANAARVGFRGRVFVNNNAAMLSARSDSDIGQLVKDLSAAMTSLGLDKVSVAAYATDAAQPNLRKNLALEALREFMTPVKAPEPVPAK